MDLDKGKYGERLACQSLEAYYQALLTQLTKCDDDFGRLKILTSMMNQVIEMHAIKERLNE